MQIAHSPGPDVPAFVLTTGVKVEPKLPGTGGTGAGAGVTLANATSYVFPIGDGSAPYRSVHIKWDAAFVGNFTLETCNFPDSDGKGDRDVAFFDDTAGNWIDERPTTAYVATEGAGVTVTNLQIAVAGGAAGGAMIHLGNLSSRRARIKAVSTTGGLVRLATHGKA